MDDNRAMRAESGVGTLPNGCCAPLAFPYVPVQKNDPERYSQQDALKAGTLFPGLNLPFHAQMKTKFPAVNTALSELMALDFAIGRAGALSHHTPGGHRGSEPLLVVYQARPRGARGL